MKPRKIKFWRTIGAAYEAPFSNFTSFLRLAAEPILVITVLVSLSVFFTLSGIIKSLLETPLALTIALIAGSYFLITFMIHWHRALIAEHIPNSTHRLIDIVSVFKYLIALVLFSLPLIIVIALVRVGLHHYLPIWTALTIISLLALALLYNLFIVTRLSLGLVALSLENRKFNLSQSWMKSKGNALRLSCGFFLTIIPPLLVLSIMIIITAELFAKGPILFVGSTFLFGFLFSIAFILSFFLVLSFGIGFLSLAYRQLVFNKEASAVLINPEKKADKAISDKSWVEISKQEARRHSLYGVTGWLFLIGFQLVGMVVMELINIFVFGINVPQNMASWIFTIALILFIVAAFILMVKKSKVFFSFFITFLVLNFLAEITTALLYYSGKGALGWQSLLTKEAGAVIYSLSILIISICYFRLSKRVNVTYRNRVRPSDLRYVWGPKQV